MYLDSSILLELHCVHYFNRQCFTILYMQSIILFSFKTISLALAFTINICGEFCLDLLTFVLSMKVWEHLIPQKLTISGRKLSFLLKIWIIKFSQWTTNTISHMKQGEHGLGPLWLNVFEWWNSGITLHHPLNQHNAGSERHVTLRKWSKYSAFSPSPFIGACGLMSWKVNQFPWYPPPSLLL